MTPSGVRLGAKESFTHSSLIEILVNLTGIPAEHSKAEGGPESRFCAYED